MSDIDYKMAVKSDLDFLFFFISLKFKLDIYMFDLAEK